MLSSLNIPFFSLVDQYYRKLYSITITIYINKSFVWIFHSCHINIHIVSLIFASWQAVWNIYYLFPHKKVCWPLVSSPKWSVPSCLSRYHPFPLPTISAFLCVILLTCPLQHRDFAHAIPYICNSLPCSFPSSVYMNHPKVWLVNSSEPTPGTTSSEIASWLGHLLHSNLWNWVNLSLCLSFPARI